MMKVLMNTGGIVQTNAFVIADEVAKQAVLFDAPDNTAGVLLDEIQKQGWELIGLWLTHGHFDHIADHKTVTDRFPNAKVLIHTQDEPKLERPMSALFHLPFVIPPRKADELLHDGQKLKIGSLDVEVIHTPGHAPGHVMFWIESEKVLVGGDLIIMGAVGRTDLPDSNHGHLMESIRKVMKKVPADTNLLPGHGDPSTLRHELETNPYVQQAIEFD